MSLRVRTSGGLPTNENSDVDISENAESKSNSVATPQDLINNIRALGATRAQQRNREKRTPAVEYSCAWCNRVSSQKDSNGTGCVYDWRSPFHQDYGSFYRGDGKTRRWHMYGIPEDVMDKIRADAITRLPNVEAGEFKLNKHWNPYRGIIPLLNLVCTDKDTYGNVLQNCIDIQLGLNNDKLPSLYDFIQQCVDRSEKDWYRLFNEAGLDYIKKMCVGQPSEKIAEQILKIQKTERPDSSMSGFEKNAPAFVYAYSHNHKTNGNSYPLAQIIQVPDYAVRAYNQVCLKDFLHQYRKYAK